MCTCVCVRVFWYCDDFKNLLSLSLCCIRFHCFHLHDNDYRSLKIIINTRTYSFAGVLQLCLSKKIKKKKNKDFLVICQKLFLFKKFNHFSFVFFSFCILCDLFKYKILFILRNGFQILLTPKFV